LLPMRYATQLDTNVRHNALRREREREIKRDYFAYIQGIWPAMTPPILTMIMPLYIQGWKPGKRPKVGPETRIFWPPVPRSPKALTYKQVSRLHNSLRRAPREASTDGPYFTCVHSDSPGCAHAVVLPPIARVRIR
jgi:hypothetical protein